MKVAILFDRFGPYHVARLKAADKYMNLYPVEIFGETSEYQWAKVDNSELKNRAVLFAKKSNNQTSSKEIFHAVNHYLSLIRPQVVAINGWYDRAALSALRWCISNQIPAIIMSESSEEDEPRVWWKEFLKKKVIFQCSTALVGGKKHVNYMKKLGMSEDAIFTGYDVIDNDYFEREIANAKKEKKRWNSELNLPQNYFLVVSRFIKKKNLPFLLKAYNQYVHKAGDNSWDLVILGDGPDKDQLKKLASELSLNEKVRFEGFKQYNELPIYFAFAKIFVHVSTTEQWGLVVNEAMASSLPVLISERCGCVPELVHNGINGYTIDPTDEASLVKHMLMLSNSKELSIMGMESKKIAGRLNTDAFGKNLLKASELASITRARKPGIFTKTIINLLAKR